LVVERGFEVPMCLEGRIEKFVENFLKKNDMNRAEQA
jgi:hypothetical protein